MGTLLHVPWSLFCCCCSLIFNLITVLLSSSFEMKGTSSCTEMSLSNSYSSSYFLTRDTKNSHVMSPCSAPGSVCGLIQGSELHPSVHSFIIIIIIQRTLRFTIVYTWSFSMCMYMCACALLFFSGSLEFKLHKTFSMHLQNRLLWSSGSVQSLSHVQLCDPMDCSRPGFPVLH